MVLLTRATAVLIAAFVLLSGAPQADAADMADSLGLSATYDVTATLKWGKSKLMVTSTALVTNETSEPVTSLTFNLAPAKIGRMNLKAVTVGGVAAAVVRSDQSLSVALPNPLRPAEQVAVTVSYAAWFGTSGKDKQWLFAKANGIATAYRWIPWLSKQVAFNRPNIGDPFVTAVSRRVRVSLTSDRTLIYATSGVRTGVSGLTQTFEAQNVRDFNFAASPKYRKTSTTWQGVKITVYYRYLPAAKLRDWTLQALKRFSNKVGPYPYSTISVAEVPFGQGMESPALVWISQTTASSSRKYIAVHEMAHQWFYGVVGNDQTAEPFTDEAMAEFLTRDMLGHRASKCSKATLDSTIYEYSGACYYEVIYVQGDAYLNAYRLRVGDSAFWAGVRNYYKTYGMSITGIRQLLDILDQSAPAGLAGGHAERFPRTYTSV